MGREWQIGDPVDYSTDGWMDAQNWGHEGYDDYDTRDNPDVTYFSRSDKYSKMAWDCHLEGDDTTALNYINEALKLNSSNAGFWNRKAIILEFLKRYVESEECYEKSLNLSKNEVVQDNLARMLYDWTTSLIEWGKGTCEEIFFDSAEEKIRKAISIVSRPQSEEEPEKYEIKLKAVDYYRNHTRKYLDNMKRLESYDRDCLFTIAGSIYYDSAELKEGLALRLVRQPDNEYDRDAIAVYAGTKKIGYVANNDYTSYEKTSKASELKDKISYEASAQYLLFLDKDFENQFHIGRIL